MALSLVLNHPALFAGCLFLLLAATLEFGFRLATASRLSADYARREQVAASRDALGVLLSLLLGFTLAMALPRYDLSRQLVIEEADAIATAGTRAEILPPPYRENVRELLVRYVAARLEFSSTGISREALNDSEAHTNELQSKLWAQAQAVALANPTPITALFLQSLNELFDLSEKRLAALENRIPGTIWVMLVALSMVTCLMFGFASRSRFWLVSIVTPLMVAVVMGLIADLDSPRNGFIRTDLSSLERLERDLTAQKPPPAPSPTLQSEPGHR